MTAATRDTIAPSAGRARARRVKDGVVTTLVIAASVFSSFFVLGAQVFAEVPDDLPPAWLATTSFLTAVGAAIALRWRHRHPALVTGIAIVPPLLLIAEALAALIALAALAASRRDHVLWAGTTFVFVATILAVERDANRHPEISVMQMFAGAETTAERVDVPLFAVILTAAVLTSVPVAIGLWRSTRRDLSRRDVKEQQLRAEVARQEERSRIAHEMHDVLGHRLSILSLQAGALEVSGADAGSRTAEAARSVRSTAKDALDDLRHVIGVLKEGQLPTGEAGPAEPERPQPTLADIPEVIASSRQAGQPVNTTILIDDSSAAPSALGAAAYRITREALTNVVRHAPGATTEVTVRGGPGAGLSVEVVNTLPDGPPTEASTGNGTGLPGVRERVSLLGGTVSAGATEEGTFALSAWLPWPRPS
ncbi:Signal transduction histidine kinase [Haloechinothrix alba]|uniref:histidine kinase n=1 Tax=Haloechinothrix alba TaxID=664784 RepID=A0A238X193_9PSEU|nr:histidine kinase [Haloechinothrix alba]SNR52686.1 Signal transduction histidine kinase [Haloechinothrix alba]